MKHKARLVAKGYVEKQGVDFEEVFALMVRLESVRLFLAITTHFSWEVHHMDVKSTFLDRELKDVGISSLMPRFDIDIFGRYFVKI